MSQFNNFISLECKAYPFQKNSLDDTILDIRAIKVALNVDCHSAFLTQRRFMHSSTI